jgi:hypothetical protein
MAWTKADPPDDCLAKLWPRTLPGSGTVWWLYRKLPSLVVTERGTVRRVDVRNNPEVEPPRLLPIALLAARSTSRVKQQIEHKMCDYIIQGAIIHITWRVEFI